MTCRAVNVSIPSASSRDSVADEWVVRAHQHHLFINLHEEAYLKNCPMAVRDAAKWLRLEQRMPTEADCRPA